MKISRFTEQQIALALRQAEHGTAIEQICRAAPPSRMHKENQQ